MGFWIALILVLLVIGTLPSYGYSRGWGYGPVGVLLVLFIIWMVVIFVGTVPFSWPWAVATVPA